MKIRNIFIFTALIVVFCLSACIDEGSNNQGVIKLNFNNSGARSPLSDEVLATMTYTVTLTKGEEIITVEADSGGTATVQVSEGTWNIKVSARGGDSELGAGRISGQQEEEEGVNVTVIAGKVASPTIKMIVTGTWVSTYEELVSLFNSLDRIYPDLDMLKIEITNDLETDKTAENSEATLNTNKKVTLWSNSGITIKRKDGITGTNGVDATVFKITKGTLILDGRRGTITIDGNKDTITRCKRALINVYEEGILEMHEGVTLTNNETDNGGAVWVEGGTFNMYGGTISKNNARAQGGGVFTKTKTNKVGKFFKTGGIVYGFKDKNNANTAKSNNNGAAVYDINKGCEDTLGEKDNWPK